MKYLKMLLCVSVVIAFMNSCKKDFSRGIDNANSSSIIGNWELRQSIGNTGTVNYASGNGSYFTFTDSAYSITNSTNFFLFQVNHPKKGIYKIVADTSANACTGLAISSGQFADRIIFDNDTASDKVFYQITNNKLIIISGYFPTDGGIEATYERQ